MALSRKSSRMTFLAGRDRWYEEFVPVADRLYDEHLETLKREGLI